MNHLVVNGISAAAGGILTVVLGGWDQLLTVFLITILIDYATGVLASIKEGSGLDSQVGFWGLTRKALMLLVIVLAHQMDVLIGSGSDVIKTGRSIFTCPTNSYRLPKITDGLACPCRIKSASSSPFCEIKTKVTVPICDGSSCFLSLRGGYGIFFSVHFSNGTRSMIP